MRSVIATVAFSPAASVVVRSSPEALVPLTTITSPGPGTTSVSSAENASISSPSQTGTGRLRSSSALSRAASSSARRRSMPTGSAVPATWAKSAQAAAPGSGRRRLSATASRRSSSASKTEVRRRLASASCAANRPTSAGRSLGGAKASARSTVSATTWGVRRTLPSYASRNANSLRFAEGCSGTARILRRGSSSLPWSALTAGAEVGAPPANDRARDHGPAGVAGLAVTAEDLDVHVLAAGVALRVDVIAEAGAAVLDAAFEHLAAGQVEASHRESRDLARRRVGPDVRLKQRLVHVDVPEPRHPPLIQQHGLHRGAAAGQELSEESRGERLVERLGAPTSPPPPPRRPRSSRCRTCAGRSSAARGRRRTRSGRADSPARDRPVPARRGGRSCAGGG